ncbi:MAG: polyprenyl synthetase family protein [Bacteroidetes bacterium]|nr:polyprenyl synthetase family protein [Bacteroidota bacterium]
MQSSIQLQEKFDLALEQLKMQGEPRELYDAAAYMIALGGKRLRPVLLMMACDLFGGDLEEAVHPAIGIELFHNFTLVHDDIMDKAPVRRSKPTVHNQFNTNIAILSGDLLLIHAYDQLSQIQNGALPEVFRIFNESAAKVCEGQQFDLNYEDSDDTTMEEYINMIEHKTAVLLAASLQIGALIGGASKEDALNLYNFGINMGIGFQIQDDILDAYRKDEKFGKQIGGDILMNKRTYLLLKALNEGDEDSNRELKRWLSGADHDPQEKIKAVLAIYDKLNVREHAEEEMQEFIAKAGEYLKEINVPDNNKRVLKEFAMTLIERAY